MKANRVTLWIILASATLTVMAGSILAPVLNLIREGLGVGTASAGLIITTHALFVALFSPLIGSIIDKIGVKKPFIFGLVLYGAAGGSGLFITSYWVLIISRALLGIGVAAVLNSITVMILNLYTGEERNKIMGRRGSANTFGGIIWPLIGGILGGFSWHLPFAVYFVGIPLGFCALITVPEIHRELKESSGPVLKVFRENPILFVIYSLFFLVMALVTSIVVFLPPLLGEMSISNPVYISLFIIIMSFSAGVTSFMYGRIKSKLSYRMIVLIVLALWTVAFTTISQGSSGLVIAAAVALFGIGGGMISPAVMVWAGETVAISFRGRIVSYLATFGYIGQFMSPVIFGPVAVHGLTGVFLAGGGVCAVLLVLGLISMRR